MARLIYGHDTTDPDEIAAAVWLYGDLKESIRDGVAAGIGLAFAKK